MPPYFDLTLQCKNDKLTSTYVRELYETIISFGFKFKSGFWFHEDATYEEIINWNQKKLEEGFRLGFTEDASNDYIQVLFDTEEFEKVRGFWFYSSSEISFHLIIPEYDFIGYDISNIKFNNKIEIMRNLAIHIWKTGLVDVIQTSLEFDGGCFPTEQVLSGEKISLRTFAIIPKNIIHNFTKEYLNGLIIESIDNDGILITDPSLL